MNFFTRSNRPPLYYTEPGAKETIKYGLEINKDGEEVLSIVGTEPIYEKIQAASVGTNISELILRWRAGDDTVLDKAHGVFGDFSDIPSDLASSQRAIMKVQNYFNSLPLSEREKYNMNFSSYLNDMVNRANTIVPSHPVSPTPEPSNEVSNTSSTASVSTNPPSTVSIDGRTYKFVQEEIKL